MKVNTSKKLSFKQGGFLHLPNDNIVKTIGVAVLLCLLCSVIVSGAATILKPQQVANKLLDKKTNILTVAGISGEGKTVDELLRMIRSIESTLIKAKILRLFEVSQSTVMFT